MASTAEATALTQRHRLMQIALREATIQDLLAIWAAFDIEDIAGTWPAVERALVALIQSRWEVSAGLAAAYYDDFRAAEVVEGPAPVSRLAPVPSAAAIATALQIHGRASAFRLVSLGRPDAAAVTLTNVTGEVSRQTLNGGRDTILDTIDADPTALGFARVTDGDPCAFCALLASRGPVYRSKSSATVARDGAKYHGKCGCSAEPVFTRESEWPGKGREYEQVYKDAKRRARASGDDVTVEFRRLIEGR